MTLEESRTRWRRWLGNKTRRDRPYWITLLGSDWLEWVHQCNPTHGPIGLSKVGREQIKQIYRDAIDRADAEMLRQLDRIYANEKLDSLRGWSTSCGGGAE
jgi:hypothetical protein